MKMRRLISAIIALLLVVNLSVTAFAAEWYLEDGDITVSAGDSGQTVSQGGGAAVEDNAPVIKGSSTENTVTINAEKDQTANVTLSGANIDVSSAGKAAVSTTGEGNVNIELNGSNALKSGHSHAGLEKNNDGNLTIQDKDKDGSLNAKGGQDGAGIGGGSSGAGSDITITGGNVTAVGKEDNPKNIGGAGIGGGGSQSSNIGRGTNLKITGGRVTAVGGNYSAGIGGGYGSNGENITISDAEVIAIGGTCSAGIGGGCRNLDSTAAGEGKNISISGSANVKAAGGVGDSMDGAGAAIGAGGSHQGTTLVDAQEGDVGTSGLSPDGSVERLDPGTTFDIPQPKPRSSFLTASAEPQPVKAALYRVIDDAGKALPVETKQEDGVLLLTAQADIAILEGAISGLQTLQSRGIDTITFTNGTISVSFSLAEVTAKGASSDIYRLTLSGGEANFTLAGADITALLGK